MAETVPAVRDVNPFGSTEGMSAPLKARIDGQDHSLVDFVPTNGRGAAGAKKRATAIAKQDRNRTVARITNRGKTIGYAVYGLGTFLGI